MISRALREGWNYDRSQVIEALMDVIQNRDPDLMMPAIALLLKGEEIMVKQEDVEIKRELMELKKLGDEQQLRLRLLELARRIEPNELARLASKDS